MTDSFKIIAIACGVGIMAWPYISPALANALKAIKSAIGSVKTTPDQMPVGYDDMTTVLRLANKLRLEGNMEGAELCQQLLDAMITFIPKR